MIRWLLGVSPKVDTVWKLRDTHPFTDKYNVRVLGIRDGWVQYLPTYPFAEIDFVKIRPFRAMYRELE